MSVVSFLMRTFILLNKKSTKFIFIAFIWLTIWEVVSLFVSNNILLVGPFDVVVALIVSLTKTEFYLSIFSSLLKIGVGFLIGAIVGVIFAVISYKNHMIEDFLNPLMSFFKAAPVASFVVLFLIWWHSNVLSIAICICVVLPQIYTSMLIGLKNTDKKLIEMSKVFELSTIDKINYIYRPSIYGYIESAVKVSAGMAWKAGVAAEVIGTPDNSIGTRLYMSKIMLDTAGVLAWTVVIILLSIICEKLLLVALKKYSECDLRCRGININKDHKKVNKITLNKISKSYGDVEVIKDYSEEYNSGEKYLYDWPSGKGKSTLFKIISSIEPASNGSISPDNYTVSYVFQDDRLIEEFSAIKNVELITGDADKAKNILLMLLKDEDLYKPVSKLSGGQRRRVAIARALAKDSDVMILDEPYEGLDIDTKRVVDTVIDEYTKNVILLIASHIKDSQSATG